MFPKHPSVSFGKLDIVYPISQRADLLDRSVFKFFGSDVRKKVLREPDFNMIKHLSTMEMVGDHRNRLKRPLAF